MIKQIIRLKPYDGGDDALRAIFRMANVDKHLELIPISPIGAMQLMSGFAIKNAVAAIYVEGGVRSLNDGIVISILGDHGTIAPLNPKAEIHVTGDVLLGNVSLYEGKPLVPFLNALTRKADEVYHKLASYCAATGRF